MADLDYYPLNFEPVSDETWEAAFAPYDEETYRTALEWIGEEEIVLDIGAGDLRLARRAARKARAVIAIERRAELLKATLPPNVRVICADALQIQFPRGVTTAVLLMRHCLHFSEYVSRLREIGCKRLITNARWRMGVELVSLTSLPNLTDCAPGWYACLCGAVGFKPLPAELLTSSTLAVDHSVRACPACTSLNHSQFC